MSDIGKAAVDFVVDGVTRIVVVAMIIAALIGLGVGYALWGTYTIKTSVKLEQRER